jgi:putative endonuclease
VVEWDGLENRFTRKGNVGSNPTLSADMKKFFIYILYSESSNRFYIGQTINLTDRLSRHNSGYEHSTKPYIPWKLVCCIDKNVRGDAMILEKKLKNLNSEDLKKFILKYSSDIEGSRGVARDGE